MVLAEGFDEYEEKAASERDADAVGAVWVNGVGEVGDGFVVVLDGKDIERIRSEVVRERNVGKTDKLVGGAQGHHGVVNRWMESLEVKLRGLPPEG